VHAGVNERHRDVLMRTNATGQALVEFSLAFIVFSVLVFGVIDFGRGIYQYNAVSQAAREIARVTSVHPGTDFTTVAGRSPETNAVIEVQRGLVPGLVVATDAIKCVDTAGMVDPTCDFSLDSVSVTVAAPFKAITPPMNALGTWTMKGTSSVQIQ
jgi:Flp pilus assembly protein TadG